MLLKDLETAELESLERAVKNKSLMKLVETRVELIKELEWGRSVEKTRDMLVLAEAKGMVRAWESLLKMPQDIKEERELRDKEKEKEALAQGGKK